MLFRKKYATRVVPHKTWGDDWVVIEVWSNGKKIGEDSALKRHLSKGHIKYRAKGIISSHKALQSANKFAAEVMWK